jgi:hypothetical protein
MSERSELQRDGAFFGAQRRTDLIGAICLKAGRRMSQS